jgi:type II secretory pathway component GspD/PulD (secretin)
MLGHIHTTKIMKLTYILLASLLMSLCPSFADDIPLGTMNLENVPASEVLTIYKQMSGLELVVDSRAKHVTSPVTFKTTTPLKKEDALKLIQSALLKQAGIVITPLDDKRASVTFNDALPITR